jgi:hypothetical protein
LTIGSWICGGNSSAANAPKARLKVGSLGISPALSQPQSWRHSGRAFKASTSAPVGGELIGVLGDEGGCQPGALMRGTTVAAPGVTAGEAAQVGKRNDFAKLLVQGAQRAEFRRERGEKLSLQMVENRRQVSPVFQTRQPSFRSNKSEIKPPTNPGFERTSLEY